MVKKRGFYDKLEVRIAAYAYLELSDKKHMGFAELIRGLPWYKRHKTKCRNVVVDMIANDSNVRLKDGPKGELLVYYRKRGKNVKKTN